MGQQLGLISKEYMVSFKNLFTYTIVSSTKGKVNDELEKHVVYLFLSLSFNIDIHISYES